MKKRKVISIIFAISFWMIYNICLFVWLPLNSLDRFLSSDGIPEPAWSIVRFVLPLCFWGIRFYLKQTNKWHKCGTILFHSLNGISILWCSLTLTLPNIFPSPPDLGGSVLLLIGAAILVCLLIIDLLIVGVKWLVQLIERRYENHQFS